MERERSTSAAQVEQYRAEHARIDERRRLLGLPPKKQGYWALALSGGGIRSATFCLGVLQALARAKAARTPDEQQSVGKRLLEQFDYLSSVSGGGYLGAFFGTLFLPDRLRVQENAQVAVTPAVKAAQDAYEVFDFEPPGRIHTSTNYRDAPVGDAPLAWLRENGRYLTPGGSGDILFILALSMRNLLALHFVIGMPLLFLLAMAALFQAYIPNSGLFTLLTQVFSQDQLGGLYGSLWWVPAAAAVLWVIPLMLAYWMVYARKDQDEALHLWNWSTVLYSAAAAMFMALALSPWPIENELRLLLGTCGLVCALGVIACVVLVLRLRCSRDGDKALARHDSVRTYRVLVTRYLGKALGGTLVLAFFAFIPWLSELVYAKGIALASSAALLPVLIGAIRTLSSLLDDKHLPGWLSRLPLSAIAGVAGLLIFVLGALMWGLLVQFVRHQSNPHDTMVHLASLAGLALILSLAAGSFIGFLNQSSLQSFYSGRLSRAYLGASNGQRFSGKTRKARRQYLSVAEPLPEDDVSIERYYGATPCAPVHLINVTLNLTVDPAEQLVQRDRKGKPLCLAPSGSATSSSVSYILDGEPRDRSLQRKWYSEIYQPLALSHWIATSGAAVSTGLGRATSLGTSLALGLTNLRLGTWWPANFLEDGETVEGSRCWRDGLMATIFPSQAYLFCELTARFHGVLRDYQYLSDGGHFENTATYELLREGRKIELIVTCDCGADPTYRFDDLANLIRLARIDQALEIEEDEGVHLIPELAPYFGRMDSFTTPAPGSMRCAMLFNVSNRLGQRTARILVLKPSLIGGLPLDVLNYASGHPTFPNESTANQFFDEAQFESYRQLGLQIGQRLFGDGQGNSVSQALMSYL
ncbi:patatin-like phospholipase family protein [Pseudomonas entomophila]|uniref:patatin-like phospholipase family protein n=1 Tax=Pseudomonas entomophila TaxID=312306 RepID=UPI001EFFA589|nr:patatin-like phospholipase family protein [Pseudomonas entomophila]MCG8291328.1 patatin-like phospholipase family protein [Pseudomonas entomophila]